MASRKQFGKTWWGKAWVDAMERIDYYTNRLPRGKRYAHGGRVTAISVDDGEVKAKVQGTRPTPYKVAIRLKKFTKQQVSRTKSIISGDPALASELALGRLPEEMLTILGRHEIDLLPSSWDDLTANCSCPDWANPCKHLAAVYYIIANEIDKNPFLLFNLRGMDTGELMQAAGFGAQAGIAVREDTFVSYREVTICAPPKDPAPELSLTLKSLSRRKELEAVFTLLSDAPLFYTEGNFKKILLKAYKNIADAMERLQLLEDGFAFSNSNYCLLYPSARGVNLLREVSFFAFPGDDIPDTLDAKSKMISSPVETEGKLSLIRKKGKLLSGEPLLDLMLALPLEPSPEHGSPAFRFLNAAAAVAQALAQSSAFVPEVRDHGQGNFWISYMPLTRVEGVQEALEYLAGIIPAGFVFRREDKSVLPGKEGVKEVLGLLLSRIVHRFAGIEEKTKLCDVFFRGDYYSAQGFEEKLTAKSVCDWLAGLYFQGKDVAPVIRIEIPRGRKERFQLQVDVENKQDPLAAPLPLAEIFTARKKVFSLPADSVRNEIARQLTFAAPYFPALKKILSAKGTKPVTVEPSAMAEFLANGREICALLGIKVVVPRELKVLASPQLSIGARFKSNGPQTVSYLNLNEMLEFSWQVSIGDLTLTREEFVRLAASAQGIVKFKNHYLLLRPEEVKSLLEKLDQPLPQFSSLEVLQATLTGEAGETGALFDPDQALKQLTADFTRIKHVAIPESLNASLRPYQERGFQWLYANTVKGFGSCLADDMGLGKTIQILTLILKLKEDTWLKNPALVICPTTLVGNWEKECKKFAPSLKVSVYHGLNRRLNTANTDLVITTYGVIRRDVAKFRKKAWDLIVIDEAQNIKNPDAEQTKAVKSLSAKAYLAMSGTPVENRLTELWSIFDYLNRGYLGTRQHFIRRFALPIEKYRDTERIAILQKATSPFILRRMKTDKSIIKDLPDKVVRNQYCSLTKEQAAMYQQVLDTAMREIENSEGITRKGLVFKLMTSLKQICNHPALYAKKGSVAKELSGKAQQAISLLENIMASKEKVLLFTQYKEMGYLLVDMIRQELTEEVLFFHGGLSRKKRDQMVADFQRSSGHPIMVISLKAGGTGLNLTAATNVIHYDLWWNPAVEAQATDRTYRIGQTEKVLVHRLITMGTFEEKIDEMISAKKELADLTVSTGEQWLTELTNEELVELFSLVR